MSDQKSAAGQDPAAIARQNEEIEAKLDAAAERADAAEHEGLSADFDAAIEEAERAQGGAHVVRMFGEDVELPRSIPFGFAVFLHRHCIRHEGGTNRFELPDDKIDEFIRRLLPERAYELVMGSAKPIDVILKGVIYPTLKLYGYDLSGALEGASGNGETVSGPASSTSAT
jgi:hypothetical protein